MRRPGLIDTENIETVDAVTYWRLVLVKKNAPGTKLYSSLKPAVLFIFTLPFSNVIVERFSSAVKVIKIDRQNKLKTETLRGILKTKYGMKRAQESAECEDYQLLHHMRRVKASTTIYINCFVYERDCPLFNALLFTLKFFIVLKSRVVRKSQTLA